MRYLGRQSGRQCRLQFRVQRSDQTYNEVDRVCYESTILIFGNYIEVTRMKMLIVDDSLIIRRKIEREINLSELTEFYTATDGEDAIEMFLKHKPEMVTMDLTMPRMEGTECVKELVSIDPDVVILVISALADKTTAIRAVKNGAYGFLCKPFTETELNDALVKCIAFKKGLKN